MVKRFNEKAEEKGVTPQAYVDEIVAGIQRTMEKLDISYDDFIRTTEERHTEVVEKIFEQIIDQGDIYLRMNMKDGIVLHVNRILQNFN